MNKILLYVISLLLLSCGTTKYLSELSTDITYRFESKRWDYGTFYIAEWIVLENGRYFTDYRLRIETTETMQKYLNLIVQDKMGPISGPWKLVNKEVVIAEELVK